MKEENNEITFTKKKKTGVIMQKRLKYIYAERVTLSYLQSGELVLQL